jgi:alcohol dehydrogenase
VFNNKAKLAMVPFELTREDLVEIAYNMKIEGE